MELWMLCNVELFVSKSGSRKLIAWMCQGFFFFQILFLCWLFRPEGCLFGGCPLLQFFFIEIKLFYSLKKETKKSYLD